MSTLDPGRIVVAGDWHGNTEWAVHIIKMTSDALVGEHVKTIIHLGDFGIWPGAGGVAYLNRVIGACFAHGVRLLFIDGNHEDFSQLDGLRVREGQLVNWLPRGYRWVWHGRQWLALGGGVSLDRTVRTEGKSWWPQEEISDTQERDTVEAGHADVLISHDCPAGVTHTFPPPPSFWDARDLARSDAHRERLQRIVNAAQPLYVVHGHLHRSYQRTCDFGYGSVEVTGLDCDEGDGANWAVLDVRTMIWEKTCP